MDQFFKGKRSKYPKLLQEHSPLVEQQQQQQQLVGMQQQQVQVHMLVVLIILNPQLNPIIRILLAMRMIKLNKTQLG